METETREKIMITAVQLWERGYTQLSIRKAMNTLHPTELTNSTDFIVNSSIDMIASFYQAVDKAGGSGWPLDELLKMTFRDLITYLSTNNVRFYHKKDEK